MFGIPRFFVFDNSRSWSDLCEAARLELAPPGPAEGALRGACGRLLHVDDPLRIRFWRDLAARREAPRAAALAERERRLVRMLLAQMTTKVPGVSKESSLDEGLHFLWRHPQVLRELDEVLGVLEGRVDHLQRELETRPEVPLRVHARYTRAEVLAAFGVREGARVPSWQSGVWWAEEARADLLAFTLDKTKGGFSPTTRYRDYAISRELIHWESQSWTRADSETGLRYREHAARGSEVFLFARPNVDERAFWCLGPATYVSHEGERPMRIRWKLAVPLPGDLQAAFAAAVV